MPTWTGSGESVMVRTRSGKVNDDGKAVAVAVGVGVGLGGVDVGVGVGGDTVDVGVGDGVAGVAVADGVGVIPGLRVGVGDGVTAGPVMVKLVLDISKHTLPMASTLTLAVALAPIGMVTCSVPSLGALATRTVGKVCPPSVDNEILTLAQLTGGSVVLFTSHVTV